MKNTLLTFIAALFTLVAVSSASGQVTDLGSLEHPAFDRISALSGSHLVARFAAAKPANDLAVTRAGFCETNHQQDVWNDTDWQPFSRYVSSCDNDGRSVDLASETNIVDWSKSYRWLRSYNAAGDITEWIRQLSPNDEYVNDSRDVHTYNELGFRSSSLNQDWDGTQWVDVDRSTTAFNSEGLAESTLDEEWDGSQWVNVERSSATDNGDGTSTFLTETWDGAAWQPESRQLYSSTDPQSYQYTIQSWDGAEWVNINRYTSAPPETTVESWNGTAWVGQQKQIEVRDASNRRIELLQQNWVSSAWQNDYRVFYNFDPTTGYQTDFLLEDWDGAAFVPDSRIGYTYDEDGNRIEDLWQEYVASTWENLIRHTSTWQAVGGVGVESEALVADGIRLVQSFPNPAESRATIRFELDRTADVTVTLVDLLGRERSTLVSGSVQTGAHEIDVDVRGLATGMYFYKLSSGETVLVGSMIVNR